MKYLLSVFLIIVSGSVLNCQEAKRTRDYGIKTGIFSPGRYNAITDVEGVRVGHVTIDNGQEIHTGVTAILPHSGNIFKEKVPAAIFTYNGFGKLAGYTQVNELGNIETPVILTNTLSVPVACEALIEHTLALPGNEEVRSVNPVVGETNDGYLNDIRGLKVKKEDVLRAINSSSTGPVKEGSVGAGRGTVCFGYKGGIGTSSRVLPVSLGGYTVGVLVQTNFGGVLTIAGVPVGKETGSYPYKGEIDPTPDGSCMIVVATDAPLSDRNLMRLARRAMLGLARTGGMGSNGSGDYVIAFSTAKELRISDGPKGELLTTRVLRNEDTSPLFQAVAEATEEAIINSLFAAEPFTGRNGNRVDKLPVAKIVDIIRRQSDQIK